AQSKQSPIDHAPLLQVVSPTGKSGNSSAHSAVSPLMHSEPGLPPVEGEPPPPGVPPEEDPPVPTITEPPVPAKPPLALPPVGTLASPSPSPVTSPPSALAQASAVRATKVHAQGAD